VCRSVLDGRGSQPAARCTSCQLRPRLAFATATIFLPAKRFRSTTFLRWSRDDGGDEDANLRVYCSACHAMVNWARTYFGHYHEVAVATETSRNFVE